MINPTSDDVGRRVVYFGVFDDQLLPAYGELTSIGNQHVFVRFGESEPMTMLREDLEWSDVNATTVAPDSEGDGPAQERDDSTFYLPFGGR